MVVLDGVERLNRLVASFILPDLAAAFEQLQTKVQCLEFIIVQSFYIGRRCLGFLQHNCFSSFRFPRDVKILKMNKIQCKNWNMKMLKITVQKIYIRYWMQPTCDL
jgi:hypothetical protein